MPFRSANDYLKKMPEFFTGNIVEITAGQDHEKLMVHEEALRFSESPKLNVLIGDNWAEGGQKLIEWKDFDAATVKRFLSFLYTGDYHVPHPEPRSKLASALDQERQFPADETGNCVSSASPVPPVSEAVVYAEVTKTTRRKARGRAIRDTWGIEPPETDNDKPTQRAIADAIKIRPLNPFENLSGCEISPWTRLTAAGSFKEATKLYENYDYEKHLLAHVQIYAFAKYQAVTDLALLATTRLKQALAELDCKFTYAASDIATSLHFAYQEIPTYSSGDDPMLELISTFAAHHFTELMHGDFVNLCVEGGDCTRDISLKISRIMRAQETALDLLSESC